MLGLPDSISVALFDLDGVLTSTAVLHQAAWKQAFDAFLRARDGANFEPFAEQDYFDHVDGRPRLDGVRAFLASRHIDPTDDLVREIGDAKNTMILAALDRGEVDPYPGSIRYLEAAQASGLRIGVVTSSRNGEAVLDAAGLTRFVEHRIDGVEIARAGMQGKPAPDSYLAGAAAFGVSPSEAVVFEDALSGLQAGRAGGFGYVVGIDRVGGDQRDAMVAAGADVVVGDLAELLPS